MGTSFFADQLRQRMKALGIKPRELSLRVGTNAFYVRDLLDGTTASPRMDKLMKLADALGCTVTDLTGESGVPAAPSAPPAPPIAEVDLSRVVDIPDRIAMPLNVPVYGVAVGGSDADFQMNGEVVDYVRRPPGLANARRVFAIYVQGDSMWPKYEAGDLVYLNPDRGPRSGDDVVIEMKPNGHKPGDCFIKRLVRRTPTQIVCQQFNPAGELVYDVAQVKAVYKVLTAAELMGV